VEYLRDYAKEQDAAGTIRYNTTVTRISRSSADANAGGTDAVAEGFVLTTETRRWAEPSLDDRANTATTGTSKEVRCMAVIVATGLSVPNEPETIDGIELTEGLVFALDLNHAHCCHESLKPSIFGHPTSAQ
jgi:cation diffusion facilitator CzcD-associated flavoprotein CzcO